MKTLIVKNISAEGPGTIEDHLRGTGAPFSIVDLNKGDALPSLDAFTHLVIMGGPMAVYELHLYEHLKQEAALIEGAIKAGKRVLGVCLGAQMLAHALGARVYPGGQKEIGWYEVAITEDGMKDPCMSELAVEGKNRAEVFQWHGDTFDLPQGAIRLASSEQYPNQAFRFSDRVYALQFHIEVTPKIVREWLEHERGIDFSKVNTDSERIFPPYRERAGKFYRNFFSQ